LVTGTTQTTAQLHPYKFTKTLIEVVKSRGAEVRIASAQGLEFDKYKVSGVRLSTNETIPTDIIIIAMGPWSGEVFHGLQKKKCNESSLPATANDYIPNPHCD
ncbi:10552_t:CDS:2, partial [Racocetra fulgida]